MQIGALVGPDSVAGGVTEERNETCVGASLATPVRMQNMPRSQKMTPIKRFVWNRAALLEIKLPQIAMPLIAVSLVCVLAGTSSAALQIDKPVDGSGIPKLGSGGGEERPGTGALPGSTGVPPASPVPQNGGGSTGVPPTGPSLPGDIGGVCGPIGGTAAPGPVAAVPVTAAPSPVGLTPATALGLINTGSTWIPWWEQIRWSLGVSSRPQASGATTGSSDYFLGDGQRDQSGSAPASLDLQRLREEWLPALIELMKNDGRYTMRRELIPALGRLLPHATDEQAKQIESLLLLEVDEGSAELRDLAILALGWGAGDRLAPRLAGWASGPSESVASATRTQAIAALSLGFLARRSQRIDVQRFAVHHLASLFDEADRRRPDLAVCAALGLALVPLENVPLRDPAGRPEPAAASRSAQARFLLERLSDRHEEEAVRTVLPLALAQLAADLGTVDSDETRALTGVLADAASALLEKERRLPAETERAMAKLLGECVGLGSEQAAEAVRKHLLDLLGKADQSTQNLALLALGRVAGRTRDTSVSGFEEIEKALLSQLNRGRANQRPYAALGLGLASRSIRKQGGLSPDSWRGALGEALRRAASPSEVAAICLAAGLLGESSLGPKVLEGFDGLPLAGVERYSAAWAVGILAPVGSLESLREWGVSRSRFPFAVAAASLALGVQGDDLWLEALWDRAGNYNGDITESIASMRGLAENRDQRSWPLLMYLAQDEAAPQLARAEAIRAAGWLAVGRGAPQLGSLSQWVAGIGWPLPEALSFTLSQMP